MPRALPTRQGIVAANTEFVAAARSGRIPGIPAAATSQ